MEGFQGSVSGRQTSLYCFNTFTEADVHVTGFYQISRAGGVPNSFQVQTIPTSRGVKYLSCTGICINHTSDISAKWKGDFTSPSSLDTAQIQ